MLKDRKRSIFVSGNIVELGLFLQATTTPCFKRMLLWLLVSPVGYAADILALA